MTKFFRKAGITLAIAFLLCGGLLLFGAIDATQIDTQDCEQRIRSKCVPHDERPICPKRIESECVPRGERPICPNPNPTPCPLKPAVPGATQ